MSSTLALEQQQECSGQKAIQARTKQSDFCTVLCFKFSRTEQTVKTASPSVLRAPGRTCRARGSGRQSHSIAGQEVCGGLLQSLGLFRAPCIRYTETARRCQRQIAIREVSIDSEEPHHRAFVLCEVAAPLRFWSIPKSNLNMISAASASVRSTMLCISVACLLQLQ